MSSEKTHQLCDWVEKIVSTGVNLTAREQDFIDDMEQKIELYGDRAMFTPKQAEWIEDIYTKRVP